MPQNLELQTRSELEGTAKKFYCHVTDLPESAAEISTNVAVVEGLPKEV